MAINAPEGTRDLLPDEALFWNQFKQTAAEVFGAYGYLPIETPIMEQTELFVRGIGEATDVVSKEMFTAISGENLRRWVEEGKAPKAKSRLSLRPEGTAGVVRAVVENNLVPQGATPFKAYYAEAMFRGERPQKGRLRQFHQVGIEWLGAPDPAADAEGIIMLMEFYQRLGFDLSKLRLLINSMGDPACRPAYRDAVRSFILDHADEMCDECRERAEINPLRAFDCKNERCHEVMQGAPLMRDNLCDECRDHYEQVKRYLDAAGIAYVEDPTLVRGLDYYTRTVFEVEAPGAGVGSIGGGGRYDGLVELEGGKPTPGVGFAVGFERAMLALEAFGVDPASDAPSCIYVANAGAELRGEVFALCAELRAAGLRVKLDESEQSPGWKFAEYEMKGVPLRLELGPKDIEQNQCVLVRRDNGEKSFVSLDSLVESANTLMDAVHDGMYAKAKRNLDENIYDAFTLEEAKRLQQEHGGFIRTMWCGDEACEIRMKEEAGMTSRCIPFAQQHLADTCAICGKPAKKMIYWGVAY